MKKIEIVIIFLLLISGVVHAQEAQNVKVYKEYFKSGELAIEMVFKVDSDEKTYTGYYKSGELRYEIFFKDNQNVAYKEYYKNGELKSDKDFREYKHDEVYELLLKLIKDQMENDEEER